MKKAFITIMACLMAVVALTLTACDDGINGTYYPTNEEMKTNLENNGYTVEVCDDLNYHEFFETFSSIVDGTLIKAVKGNDYIYFVRVTESWRCDTVYKVLNEKCMNYDTLVKIENDEKFGNIVYCGTTKAIRAAGINVVKVSV
ncbi:MAG: hypothetical protein K2J01_04100 [Clostridiales bacterium]|nr:hypothetical protein [Clostridiales bacterium]